MKTKLLAAVIGIFMLVACGNETKEEIEPELPEVSQDSLTTIEADFIYLADAAVLKGRSFIYGVELDSVSRELISRVEPLKRDEFDMIPVIVRAKVIENPGQEGWDEIAQIREILEISEKETDSVEAPALNNN